MFLRITHAISRRQEYAADALAVRTVGAIPLATGLRSIHGAAGAFVPYWFSEVAPLLERGFRPPIAAGFTQFLGSPRVAPMLEKALDQEMTEGTADPYDTHPPLGDAAAQATSDTGPRAITLLNDVEELEGQLLEHVIEEKRTTPFATIAWSDSGARVWSPFWQDKMRVAGDRIRGITPAYFPLLVSDLPGLAVRFGFSAHREAATEGGGVENAMQLLGSGLAVALLDRGWTVSSLPGDAFLFSRDGASVTPMLDLSRLARGEIGAGEWEAIWEPLGLLDLDLGNEGGVASARN